MQRKYIFFTGTQGLSLILFKIYSYYDTQIVARFTDILVKGPYAHQWPKLQPTLFFVCVNKISKHFYV